MPIEPVKELTITRLLNAPRELVFKAWTDEKHMAKWWGPKGFTNPVCKMDVRPGGAILIHMANPESNTVLPMTGRFYEIDEPSKLVFSTLAFEDANGVPGLENLNTITFEDIDGKTKLTVHVKVLHAIPEIAAALSGMSTGWGQSLDRLADLVENR